MSGLRPRAPDFVIWQGDQVYLRRWHLLPRNKWFNVYLHNFLRSDEDRAQHDHPYRNCSILLSGSYIEWLTDGEWRVRRPWRPWAPWRLTFRRAETAHRVELIHGAPVWSLFITGPRTREWGFHCPHGWIPWTAFVEVVEGGNKAGAGCGDDFVPSALKKAAKP